MQSEDSEDEPLPIDECLNGMDEVKAFETPIKVSA